MPDGCDEKIVGFEITMDNPVGVKVFHGERRLGEVHAGDVDVQRSTDVLQESGDIAAFDVLHDET